MDTKPQNHGDADDAALIGRKSDVLPGRFGEELTVTQAEFSRGGGHALPTRPLLLCLHGWGSNERDMAGIMRYLAPYNDYVSLRAPLVLAAEEDAAAGAYSWFHDAVPTGDDRDRDLYAAACAVDRWVEDMIPADRAVVPVGFSQGGALAVHLLRVRPERYRAAVAFSGFVGSGAVPGTAPADERLAELEVPVFFGYGRDDEVMPKYELFAATAWLEEHTWLTAKGYRGLDHAVSMDELTDVRQWMLLHDIASGVL
ncbi:alpha/beta hydrolase [Bifidobacterium leontopitheci]|uniref:Esterase n=1 Tax=Bifidobacterium leontopitheci TaxID=2650774 RepID=A0A6I1GM08_9BIFI|nr:dienelactone hydrolase family protein [Bifidobacterium leontopitheci]KAB7789048.1 esterase [Bifidobacterium leontopitheci]